MSIDDDIVYSFVNEVRLRGARRERFIYAVGVGTWRHLSLPIGRSVGIRQRVIFVDCSK